MRFLNQFNNFDFDNFSQGKVFIATGVRPWADHSSGAALGTIVDAVIYTDNTSYTRKEGDTSSNRFEKISFKVSKRIDIPADTQIRPINPVATIWGDFRNNLSVRADDIEIIPRAPKAAA